MTRNIIEKNVPAAYDIALFYTALSSVVYVFNGQYTVRIALTDELAALDGLQIVYVGENGIVEINATTVPMASSSSPQRTSRRIFFSPTSLCRSS